MGGLVSRVELNEVFIIQSWLLFILLSSLIGASRLSNEDSGGGRPSSRLYDRPRESAVLRNTFHDPRGFYFASI